MHVSRHTDQTRQMLAESHRPTAPCLTEELRLADVATVDHAMRARAGYGGGDVSFAVGSVDSSAAKGCLYRRH